MSSKKKKDNEVGYKRPPVSGRFSATNQPKRPPHYARPKGKTISEIERSCQVNFLSARLSVD